MDRWMDARVGSGLGSILTYKRAKSCQITEKGVLAMWSGAVPTVYRNGINQATMFVSKNKVDEALWGKVEGDGGKKLAIWQSMASGFIATCPGMVLTNPFDIAVSRGSSLWVESPVTCSDTYTSARV